MKIEATYKETTMAASPKSKGLEELLAEADELIRKFNLLRV